MFSLLNVELKIGLDIADRVRAVGLDQCHGHVLGRNMIPWEHSVGREVQKDHWSSIYG